MRGMGTGVRNCRCIWVWGAEEKGVQLRRVAAILSVYFL
jgi:hypothetical protein